LGIVNGIDDTVWNPANDDFLAARFDAQHIPARAANKAASRFGLDQDPKAFVIGVVSRLTLQKGVDVLLGAVPVLIAAGAQIALLGSGTDRSSRHSPPPRRCIQDARRQ
jgi:starch synthase